GENLLVRLPFPMSANPAPIDCDVHPAVPGLSALHPYLDDLWRETIVRRGLDELNTISYPARSPCSPRTSAPPSPAPSTTGSPTSGWTATTGCAPPSSCRCRTSSWRWTKSNPSPPPPPPCRGWRSPPPPAP